MMGGYDLEEIRRVSEAVGIPVIASCGAGTYEHMAEAIRAGASAVAAGAMFQFTHATPGGAAEYLARQGIEARV
jgi:cyclase